MSLTGEQFEQIQTALLDASERVPIQAFLPDEFVSETRQNFEDVEDSEVIPRLMVWAIEHETLPQLLADAAQLDSDNLPLQKLANDVQAWVSAGSIPSDRPNRPGDQILITVGEGAQFVAAGKNIKQTVYYVQPPQNERERRNRQAMLKLVHDTWVKGVLEKSLYNEVLIELGMERADDAVVNPWDMVIHVPEQEHRQLPKGTRIVDVFDEMNQSLLILGEPGSGKTTMLLELARDAITRAQKDETLPIPAILNLSSWAGKRQRLEGWIVDELNSKYRIPKRVAQSWTANDRILLLFDGLDEVQEKYRHECVRAINAFRQDYLVAMAICSRTKEYEALTTQLNLYGAVALQPLTAEDIDAYLNVVGGDHQVLKRMLQEDSTLQEFVASPLTFNIMMLAYQHESVGDIQALEVIDDRRKHLFDAYISKMFGPAARTFIALYPSEHTIRWLRWLATGMLRHSQSEFLIERLQPDWLSLYVDIRRYRLGVGLVVGTIAGLIAGLTAGLIAGLDDGLLLGWIAGLYFGLIIGLVVGLFAGVSNIRPVEKIHFNWHQGLTVGLVRVVIAVLVAGLVAGPIVGLAAGLSAWLYFLISSGLNPERIRQTSYPNQGILGSVRNILIVMLIVGCTIGLIAGLIAGMNVRLVVALPIGIIVGLVAGLIAGLMFGGVACVQHVTLRIFLWKLGYAPLNYARFLDYCHECIFLRKVGGGYIFIHRMLMEHFAAMTEEDIERIVSSVD